jgi:HD-like signal output (HDOD) protein
MSEPELIDQELERVASGIGIPPCPSVLNELGAEARKANPSFSKLEELVCRDVGLSATLLKTVNSPFYGLRNKVTTVKQAVSLLGLKLLTRTVAGLLVRRVFSSGRDQAAMERFWDTSGKLAQSAGFIAKQLPGLNKEEAYTFGLFLNVGIPVLMMRFPGYKATLANANGSAERRFTDVENDEVGTDHAVIGYLLTRSWSLPAPISQAIRYHHDYALFGDLSTTVPRESLGLAALGLLADRAVQLHTGKNFSLEWDKGGPAALGYLGLSVAECAELLEEAKERLDGDQPGKG